MLFVYSVEVDEQAPGSAKPMPLSAHKQIVDETLHCLNVAADFEDKHASANGGKGTWVAIKLVRLLPLPSCIRNSQGLRSRRKERDGARRRSFAQTLEVPS